MMGAPPERHGTPGGRRWLAISCCAVCAACTHTEDIVGFGPGTDTALGGSPALPRDPPPNVAGAPPTTEIPTWGAFTPPRPIPALALEGAEDDDPSVTADLLELYFDSTRPGSAGSGDIWVSRRSRPEDDWGPPEPVAELNSSAEETTPSISPDGLVLHFASNRPGGRGSRDVWVTRRTSREEPWSAPVNVAEINTELIDGAPHVDASGLRLVFTRFIQGSGDELFSTRRATPDDPWEEPQPITDINGPGKQGEGQLLLEGRLLVWTGKAPDEPVTNLYWAERTDDGSAFSAATPIAALNSAFNDTDCFFVPDRSYVVFASERDGRLQIYESFHEQ